MLYTITTRYSNCNFYLTCVGCDGSFTIPCWRKQVHTRCCIRCCNEFTQLEHAYWTSLNHRKNVLSCVYRSYHLPFRAHRNTWKTTFVPQCLVNSSKCTSRRNSSIGETSSIFFNRSLRITIAKTIYKMQYSTWENTKGILATQYTIKHSLRNHSEYWTPWRKCISLERH